MVVDLKKVMPPLFTRDWTQMNQGDAFFQKATYQYLPEGITTENERHEHQYEIDEHGNGWAFEAVSPQDSRIKHKHEIKNWIVQSSESNCWPDCEEQYGVDILGVPIVGVPPHIHLLVLPVDSVTGETISTLPNRYSAVVITDEITTDGDEARLAGIKNSALTLGFANLLKFYNKVDRGSNNSALDEVFVEDWYLSERPKSKIRILISIPMELLDGLNRESPPEIVSKATEEIYFNTSTLEKKIKGVVSLLNKFDADMQSFQGKIQGIDIPYQIKLLRQFTSQVSILVQANNFTFDRGRSDLLAFGINDDYKFLYGQWNPGTCFKNLTIDFNKFQESPPASNERTVHFLSNLDEIYGIYSKDEKYSWSKFFEDYMLNPPEMDFSELPMESCHVDKTTAEKNEEADAKEVMTEREMEFFKQSIDYDPGYKADTKRKLDSAAEFVGDSMVSGLGSVVDGLTTLSGYATRNPGNYLADGVWKDILNKIPIQNLIAAAMECLGFRGFEYVNLSKQFLNQASGYLEDVAKLFDIPALNFPDDFPVADYMKGLGKKIGEALLNAVMSVLIEALVGIIEELLNLCNECALQNEAAGLSRHDGLNFGGLDLGKEFGQAFGGGILGTITTTIARGTQIERAAAQLHAETEAHAKKPLMIIEKGDVGWLPDDSERERIQQEAEETKNEFGDFMRASSTVLTPGEMGNMLLGCGVGNAPLNAVEELMKTFPHINAIAGADPTTPHNFITKLFAEFGKLLGNNPILQKVKEATEAIPVELQCLTDVDDLALRTKLLSEKGLNAQQVKEQVKKSQDRKKRKLKELSVMLEKDNVLDGILPDIYCKMVYRKADGTIVPNEKVMVHPIAGSDNGVSYDQFLSKETGEELFRGVKQGLMEKDPPSFLFMMDQVLDTIYDGITMSFNQDITNFIPTLTKGSTTQREVPRTKLSYINGRTQLELNPEWVKLVKDPNLNYEFGALKAESVVPAGTYRMTAEDEGFWSGPDVGQVRYITDPNFVGNDRRLTIRQNMAMVAGQMEMGSGNPTGDQEREWEIVNMLITSGTGGSGRSSAAGQNRVLNAAQGKDDSTNRGRRRVTEYDPDDSNQRRLSQYTQKFGYSPIPVIVKDRGEQILAPGLKDAFSRMCIAEDLFTVYDSQNQFQIYSLKVPNNVFQAAGVSYADISSALNAPDSGGGNPEVMGAAGIGGITEAEIQAGATKAVEALSFINNSAINLRYVIPFSSQRGDQAEQMFDVYDVALTMEAQVAGSVSLPSLILYMSTEKKLLKTPIKNVITSIESVVSDGSYTSQEKFFTALNQDIWKGGGAIYQNGRALGDGDRPDYAQGIGQGSFDWDVLKEFYLDTQFGPAGHTSSSYDCLWKDFYCALTNNISNSPFLDLEKMATINLTPMNEMGQTCDLFQGLLDIELIKQRVKEEYGLVQCIETCFPNVDGLGTNKDNPFEKANLGGAVLLTIRTYVLEILLRSVFAFYYFRFNNPEDIDSLLISYIAQSIKKDITEKQFIKEFTSETIKLYNRNAPNLRPIPVPPTNDFDVALNYFTRWQIYGVSNRLTKTVGSIGDTSLDSILVEEWIPSYPVPATIGSRILGATKPDDPDPAGTQVTAEQALAMVGEGPLSISQVRRFNWADPKDGGAGSNSYTLKYPLGFFFRKYYSWPNQNLDESVKGGAVKFGASNRPPAAGTGGLLRGGTSRIWSMDAPVTLGPANFTAEQAHWLGSAPVRSINKPQLSTDKWSNWVEVSGREWWTLYDAGFLVESPTAEINTNAGNTIEHYEGDNEFETLQYLTPAGYTAMNPQPLTKPGPGQGTAVIVEPMGRPQPNDNTPYEYGVSYFEQKAMSVLIKMLAASVGGSSAHRRIGLRGLLDVFGGAEEYTMAAIGVGQQAIIYPGYFLKQETRRDETAGMSKTPHEFRYGDVWDRANWNWTGRQAPDWIKKSQLEDGGYGIRTGRRTGGGNDAYTYAPNPKLGQGPPGRVKTRHGFYSPEDYNFRYMNNSYMSWVKPWKDGWMHHELIKNTMDEEGTPGWNAKPRQQKYWHLWTAWNGIMDQRDSGGYATAEGNFVRYVKIDGKWIGPWRNEWIATHGTLPEGKQTNGLQLFRRTMNMLAFGDKNLAFGKGRWRLTDPNLLCPGSEDACNSGVARMPQLVGTSLLDSLRQSTYFNLQNRVGGAPETSQDQNLKRAVDLLYTGMPYLSLLDFDISSIKSILKWEKTQLQAKFPTATNLDAMKIKYDEWIDAISIGDDSVMENFSAAGAAREDIASTLRRAMATGGVARRPTPKPNTFTEGNFITEYYLRIKELPYQGMPFDEQGQTQAGRAQQATTFGAQMSQADFEQHVIPIEETKWKNSNFVDVAGRTEFLKGVVNINEFQTYLNSRFREARVTTSGVEDVVPVDAASTECTPLKLTKALIRAFPEYEACGEAQAAILGISADEHSQWVLGDFFEKVSIGMRISYVTPLKNKDFVEASSSPSPPTAPATAPQQCFRYHSQDPSWAQLRFPTSTPLEPAFKGIQDDSPWFNQNANIKTWENAAMKEKAFFIKELCFEGKEGCAVKNPNSAQRWVHVVPIVSVEQEIPKNTLMTEIVHKPYTREGLDENGLPIQLSSDFFINEYYQRLTGPQGLRAEIKKTDEFKALFKYFFPIDRMLSLSNIYSSVYLSSFKGIDGLLDGTKVNLKRLFFSLLGSGNYKSDGCGPTNKDLQLTALNGLDIEGLATTMMIMMAKAALLIFKGFVEIADINIAVSRKIVDAIHLTNKLIVQAQTMANQAQQLGASIAALGGPEGEFDPVTCKKTNLPAKPPDEWFEPVEENLIWEPPIFLISLALLPITILPLLWPGLPITPFGMSYWWWDLKPAPNWLNAIPPGDHIDKLLNKKGELSTGAEMCTIDIGLPPPSSGENNGGE